MSREEILKRMADNVVVGDEEGVRKAAEDWASLVKDGKEKAYIGIVDGLALGMKVVGDKYEAKEYFLPEVLLSADAMYDGLNVLLPLIPKSEKGVAGTIVIGVVEGDIHDIGKNIVKAMLTAAGYDMYDMGRDVPTRDFVDKAKETKAQVVALSTMMSPTLLSMKAVEEALEKEGMKETTKTIVGGGTVTKEFQERIGADSYGKDAVDAVDKVKQLIDTVMKAVELMRKKEEAR